jgi:hypothetical protein
MCASVLNFNATALAKRSIRWKLNSQEKVSGMGSVSFLDPLLFQNSSSTKIPYES